jgi:hypothetical protein
MNETKNAPRIAATTSVTITSIRVKPFSVFFENDDGVFMEYTPYSW